MNTSLEVDQTKRREAGILLTNSTDNGTSDDAVDSGHEAQINGTIKTVDPRGLDTLVCQAIQGFTVRHIQNDSSECDGQGLNSVILSPKPIDGANAPSGPAMHTLASLGAKLGQSQSVSEQNAPLHAGLTGWRPEAASPRRASCGTGAPTR